MVTWLPFRFYSNAGPINPDQVYDIVAAEYDLFTVQALLQQIPLRQPYTVIIVRLLLRCLMRSSLI